jgi:hypothetical protein
MHAGVKRMSRRDDKLYHCPHCGRQVEPGRLGGATNIWDVARLVVIFAGVIGMLLVLFRFGR